MLNKSGWMFVFSSLMLVLLCFFIVLFSVSDINRDKFRQLAGSFSAQTIELPAALAEQKSQLISGGLNPSDEIKDILEQAEISLHSAGEQSVGIPDDTISEQTDDGTDSEMQSRAKTMHTYLSDKGIETEVTVSYNTDYVKLTIEGEILFDTGKATLKPEAGTILDLIDQMMIDKGYEDCKLQIEGHTDNGNMSTVQFPNNWYLSAARAIAVGTYFISNLDFDPAMIACIGYGENLPVASNDTAQGRAQNRRIEIKIMFTTANQDKSDVQVAD